MANALQPEVGPNSKLIKTSVRSGVAREDNDAEVDQHPVGF